MATMLSLRTGLAQTQTASALAMRADLRSEETSLRRLLQTSLIHQHYLAGGGHNGPFGFPISNVQFGDKDATRDFRGGGIRVLGADVHALGMHKVRVTFLGFKCIEESAHDQLSDTDEPYFIITVDSGTGAPVVRKFEFEGIETDTEIFVGAFLVDGVPPNPMAIRVLAYENDHGDPDETAKKIQETMVMLSQQAAALASASDAAGAADGPGIGPSAGAAGVGGIVGGPLGALVAAGIVQVLGLGDDFINQSGTVAFSRPENVGTPAMLGMFKGTPFNSQISVDGGDEGRYELFFDIHVVFQPPSPTV
jgi:hypothetical protein